MQLKMQLWDDSIAFLKNDLIHGFSSTCKQVMIAYIFIQDKKTRQWKRMVFLYLWYITTSKKDTLLLSQEHDSILQNLQSSSIK